MTEKAVANWLEASHRAARTSANAEAYESLKRGLVDLEGLPEGVERDERELDLQLALINPLIALKGYSAPETTATSTRAIALCRQTGQASRIFPALYGQWSNFYVRGHIARTKELGADYLELAKSQQEIVPRLVGHRIMGTSSVIGGSPSAALHHLEQARALFDPSRDAETVFSFGQDVSVAALCWLSLTSCLVGYPDRADSCAQETVSRSRTVDQASTMCLTLMHMLITALLLRDRQTLERYTAELQPLAHEHGLPLFRAAAMPFQGVVLGLQARPQKGLEEVEQGIETMASLQFKIYLPVWLLIRVELLRDLGRAETPLRPSMKLSRSFSKPGNIGLSRN